MKRDEYIKTIVFNGHMINLGCDDPGQTFFIEYIEDGELKEECIGSYICDYEDYIEWRFGDPAINCPHYDKVTTSETESCTYHNKSLCFECRKFYNDVDWAALQKRRGELEKLLEEKGL
jgi:hypothetical protein